MAKYCKNGEESKFDSMTDEERKADRDSYKTGMSIDFKKVKKAVDESSYG